MRNQSAGNVLRWTVSIVIFLGWSVITARSDTPPVQTVGSLLQQASPTEHATTPKVKVLIATDKDATTAFTPNPEAIHRLFDRALIRYSGKPDIAAAWRTVVKTQDVVGIKVFSRPGANSGTRSPVVAAMVEGLLAAGLPATNIIIWDKSMTDLKAAGYLELGTKYGVRIESAVQAGYDDKISYTNPVTKTLVWGDHEFGKAGEGVGRRSFVSNLVTKEITKIICVSPLLNHNVMGIMGCLASVALGSVDNTIRFEDSLDRLSTAVPEIYAMPQLGDRVALNIMDALICQYEGEQQSLLHYSTELNQIWISTDPVALDVIGVQELKRQRDLAGVSSPRSPIDLFQNATLLEIGTSDIRNLAIELAE